VKPHNEKILKNSYKTGDNLKGDEYEFDNKLIADEDYMSMYMKDSYDIDSVEYTNLLEKIETFINENERFKLLTDSDETKYTKEDINDLFTSIYEFFMKNPNSSKFMRIAYMFDILCVTTNVKHSNMFDLLSYENKSIILKEFINESNEDITQLDFIF
jgi:hypothetical protein